MDSTIMASHPASLSRGFCACDTVYSVVKENEEICILHKEQKNLSKYNAPDLFFHKTSQLFSYCHKALRHGLLRGILLPGNLLLVQTLYDEHPQTPILRLCEL